MSVFWSLSVKDNLALTTLYLMQELDDVISFCEGNKSLDLDGFLFSFLRRFWNSLREDVWQMFDESNRFASLPRSFACYFVTLIPKVKSPIHLSDIRPILWLVLCIS